MFGGFPHGMQTVCACDDGIGCECVELTDRELSVCSTICASPEPISFTELKQSTNLHQEIVSRIVKRLTIHGLVTRADGKYQGKCDC